MSKKQSNKKSKIDHILTKSSSFSIVSKSIQPVLVTLPSLASLKFQRLDTAPAADLIWYYDDAEQSPAIAPHVPDWKAMTPDMCNKINRFLQSMSTTLPSPTTPATPLIFKHGTWTFDLDKKIQINCSSNRQRPIKSEANVLITRSSNTHCDTLPSIFQSLTTQITSNLVGVTQRQVEQKSDEWKLIRQYFNRGAWRRQPRIKRIVAYTHSFKAKLYELTKEQMQLKYNGAANELMAFHGTKFNDPDLVMQRGGVDMRYGASGMFGQGAYLTEDAAFVHEHQYRFFKEQVHETVTKNGQKRKRTEHCFVQLMVKALVGKYKYVPPQHHTNTSLLRSPDGYDSIYAYTADDKTNMFVVYDNNQLYTSYSIEYKV